MDCTVTFIGNPGAPLMFSLFYKTTAESEWVLCDTHNFQSATSSAPAQLIKMENIPEGSHSVKLELSTSSSLYTIGMKHPNDGSYVTSFTYGSGNDGWNQDVSTDIVVKAELEDD